MVIGQGTTQVSDSDKDDRDFTELAPPDEDFGGRRGDMDSDQPPQPVTADPNAVTEGLVSEEEGCQAVSTWLLVDTVAEDGMVDAINTARALGTACSPPGIAPYLLMTPRLRCSARLHAVDMVERNFFGEISPEGKAPEDRFPQHPDTDAESQEAEERFDEKGEAFGPEPDRNGSRGIEAVKIDRLRSAREQLFRRRAARGHRPRASGTRQPRRKG